MVRKITIILIIIGILSLTSCKNSSLKTNTIDTWYHNAMNFDDLSKLSDGDSQLIAFIDSGIASKLEEEYGDRIVYTYNVVDDSDNVEDIDAHGTKITSIACNDGSYGVYGLASKSKILIYKVTDEHGKTKSEYLSKAINDAVNHNATIINISIGGYRNNQNVEEAVRHALEKGVTVVAAAGDYGDKDLLYPAKYDGVISTQGLDSKFNLWSNSNYEEIGVLTFPCEKIEAIDISNDNSLFKSQSSGTSQATAIASAYIALLKDYYLDYYKTELDNHELIDILSNIDTFANSGNEYLKPFVN